MRLRILFSVPGSPHLGWPATPRNAVYFIHIVHQLFTTIVSFVIDDSQVIPQNQSS